MWLLPVRMYFLQIFRINAKFVYIIETSKQLIRRK